jgi:methyl-accepting chemotaxis protein
VRALVGQQYEDSRGMNTLISNLRMAHKFLLVGLIALVMLAVPSTLVLQDRIAQWSTARNELAGLPSLNATLSLIRLTQQHRGFSAGMLAGNESMVAKRQAKQTEVDSALASVQGSLGSLGVDHINRALGTWTTKWKALSDEVSSRKIPAAQSFSRHTALIADALTLLEDINHEGGLVFESDPATYFLQAAVLAALPKVTEDLGQMRARGTVLLTRGEASGEDRARFEGMTTQLQQHMHEAAKLLDQVSQINPYMGQSLAKPLAAARSGAEQALKLMDEQILHADKIAYPAGDYFAAYTRVIDEQFTLMNTGFTLIDEALTEHVAAVRSSLIWLCVSLIALSALAVWVMWIATRTTTEAVGNALSLAQAVADGDLRSRVQAKGSDEIAQLLRALAAMNSSLETVVSGVRQNAESVATASAQIAQGNQDLSGRTEQQAAALQQTAATMDELGSTVRSTADHARQANQLAQDASSVAQRGNHAVSQVVQTMKGINDSSRRIADITSTIDSIAFQTNILALNAAVEAARAGEQGRGFAVVAGEVRLLAQRAADAAREIKQLIAASVESVAKGAQQVDAAGVTMTEVVAAIEHVRAIVAEISSASTEQSTGVHQVGEAVAQMDRTTQQNAALVEQSAAAAESLRQQAGQLLQGVSAFKLGA